ncbi:MFS transporter [Saccharothrix violaceirubra]|uniref:MFS family permease n=1 Tax=Saccharothrix violaceirubra TaxID=413306 RepID=A0A7W7T7M1_9PSEU|nr:MFS transporter [Saccharothrix violaceirubra]MBB4968005.1 MFS family permease [Saccharothrix violaceirubra]
MLSPRAAVFAAFLLNGAVFGTWASRVPALAAQVGADEGTLGLSLLGASIGLAATAPFAARACAMIGARLVVLISGTLGALLLPVLGLVSDPVQLGVALVGLGSAIAALDVSMNLSAVSVIRRLDRPLMPQFHAGFSVGGLFGSVGAAVAASNGLSPERHFLIATVVCLITVVLMARTLPGGRPPRTEEHGDQRSVVKRPVLWLLAGIALCSAIAEGASADWSALFFVRERAVSEGTAAAVYACFSIAMAIARLVGEPVQRRVGPYRLLAGGGVLAAAGVTLAVAVPVPLVGFVGFTLAGLGLAFGFPVVMELAGEAGRRADGTGGERELGLVTTVAYTGFLAGPPLVGTIAHQSSLSVSLAFVAVVIALMIPTSLLAARARRRELTPEASGSVRPS